MGVLAPFSLRLRDLCWFIVGIDIAHVYTYFGHIINMVSQILPKKHELADFGLKNKNRRFWLKPAKIWPNGCSCDHYP